MSEFAGSGGGGRLPPHNLEAERSALGGVLLKPSAFDEMATVLVADDFFLPAHREIFEAMMELDRRRQPLDPIALGDELKTRGALPRLPDGESYLLALTSAVPTAENIAHYVRLVKEKATLRRLIGACSEVQSRAYGEFGNFEEFLDEAETAIFKVAQQNRRETFSPVAELITPVLQLIEARGLQKKEVTGVPTGFSRFDKLTGGLQPENLIIVAARPGVGKTSWAVNVAVNAALDHRVPVLIFSLEMSKYELMERMLAGVARVDSSRMRRGMIEYNEWKHSIYPAGSKLERAPILIDDSAAVSILEIRAKARRFRGDPKLFPLRSNPDASDRQLGLIVVDYLQLARGMGGKRDESREREIADISRGLKSLAKDLKIPVIAVSQLNRGLEKREDKRPQLSDLRECVTGDTLVCLADGRRVPIADLVGTTPEVVSVSAEGRVVIARAERVWPVGTRPVLIVRLASGRTMRVTGEHRLLGATGWVTAAGLQPGDRIALARRLPEPSATERWPERRLVLLGQMIGGGSYLRGQPMRYTTASQENSAAVADAAREEFGASVKRYAGRGAWHQLLISGNGTRWSPAGVNRWLRELGIFGQRAHEKRIPADVFRLSDDQIAVVLRHLWATDGTIHPRAEGRGGHTVRFRTTSEALAADVAALLLRLGVHSRRHLIEQGRSRPVHAVAVSGAGPQRLFLSRVGAFGPHQLPARRLETLLGETDDDTNVDTLPVEVFQIVQRTMLARGISQRPMVALRGTSHGASPHFGSAPSRAVISEYATLLQDERLAAWATSDLWWDRVGSIAPGASEEEVFDLTVPGPASWLADGVVSHNSGAIEQDADMILFIHREEYFTKAEEDSGKAELIIGKNRHGATGTIPLTFLKHITKFENAADEEEYSE